MDHSISFVAQGLKLSGVIHLPNQAPSAAVIGCHGLMADKNSPKQLELAGRCTAVGMAYFRFDHRGCGQSEGEFESDTTLENRTTDLIAAVQAVGETLGEDIPIGLFGSSLGGTVCLSAARMISPFAIVTLAAPAQSKFIQIPNEAPQSLKNEILKQRLTFNILTQMASIDHILVIHGSHDETVEVKNAHRIYYLARNPKARLILENGDHRISQRCHQENFIRQTVQWFSKCYQDQYI